MTCDMKARIYTSDFTSSFTFLGSNSWLPIPQPESPCLFSLALPGHVHTHWHNSASDYYIKEADLSESVSGNYSLITPTSSAEELITRLIGANRSNFSSCSKLVGLYGYIRLYTAIKSGSSSNQLEFCHCFPSICLYERCLDVFKPLVRLQENKHGALKS